MTGLDLLMHTESLRGEISRREERIETLRRLAESVGCPLPSDLRVQSSPDPWKSQRLLAEAVDESEAIRSLTEEQAQVLEELVLLISRLPDSQSAEVMQLRYLERLPWDDVLRRVHLSRSRIFELHRKSLRLFRSWTVNPLHEEAFSAYTYENDRNEMRLLDETDALPAFHDSSSSPGSRRLGPGGNGAG